jgi:hypothetical protein
MPSKTAKKEPAAALPRIPEELIGQMVSGRLSAEAVRAASMASGKALIERAPGAEPSHGSPVAQDGTEGSPDVSSPSTRSCFPAPETHFPPRKKVAREDAIGCIRLVTAGSRSGGIGLP